MTCLAGFDPYLDRDDAFVRHLARCPHCTDVTRILGEATSVWKEEAAADQARAVFRERRLSLPRATRPVRATALGALVFVALGASSAWAFGHLSLGSLGWLQPASRSTPPASEPQRRSIAAAASAVPAPAESAEPDVSASQPSASAGAAQPTAVLKSANELWAEGMRRLEHGDRVAAARLFERVAKAPNVEPALRHRAMFRIAEIQLTRGDTVTPRAALSELVAGPDRMLGFDAALLLERCQPEARGQVWESYLAIPPDEPMRTEALARQRAALTGRASSSVVPSPP